MITEDYVSFETAKLLKERGFKEWCEHCYGVDVRHKGTSISFDEECELKSAGLEDEIEYVEGGYLYNFGCDNRKEDAKVWAAPTLSMAMKWLREKNIFIDIFHYNFRKAPFVWLIFAYNKLTPRAEQTYEQAAESAIKYILENWNDINEVLEKYYKNDEILPEI